VRYERVRRLVAWLSEPWAPLIALGVLTGVVAWMFYGIFEGEPCGNDNTHHFAEVVRLTEAMRAGDWDWWNPAGNAGYASGYYYQIFPHAIAAAFAAVTGCEPLTAFQLANFLPLVFAPAFAYRALRVLGCNGWQAFGGAFALAFLVGENRWGQNADGVFMSGLYGQLWALVVFPLAFAHGLRWMRDARSLAPSIVWGLVVGLAHPICGVALGLALGIVWTADAINRGLALLARRLHPVEWAHRWATMTHSGGPPFGRLAILGVALLLGSACVWLPVLVCYDGFGGFPHRVNDEVGPGFIRLGKDFAKGAVLDHGRPALLTALIPLSLVFAWIERRLLALWWPALLFAFLLGIGPNLPKAGGNDDLLPAVRFLGTMQIMLALAIGAGVMASAQWAWKACGPLFPWSLPIRAAIFNVVALVAAISSIRGQASIRSRVNVATDFEDMHLDEVPAIMAALREQPPGRVQSRGGSESHWMISLPYAYGEHPAFLVMGAAQLQSSPNYVYAWEYRDHVPDVDETPYRAAWIYDAPLVIQKKDNRWKVQQGEKLMETETFELLRLPAPGLVGPVHITGALEPGDREGLRKQVLAWQRTEAPMRNEHLAWPGSGAAADPPHGRTLTTTRDNSTITAEVEVEPSEAGAATTFVVRESWHPHWRATLDGQPVQIRRITPDFMAVVVPPGRHVIVWQFDRPLWTWLLWLIGPLLALLAAIEQRLRRRAGG
jgi:hypothetical protein